MPDWTGAEQRVRGIPLTNTRFKNQQRRAASLFAAFAPIWRANPLIHESYSQFPDLAGPARYFSKFVLQMYHRENTVFETYYYGGKTAYYVGAFTRAELDSPAKYVFEVPQDFYVVERYKRSRWLKKPKYIDITSGQKFRAQIKVSSARSGTIDYDTAAMKLKFIREYIESAGVETESEEFSYPYQVSSLYDFEADETAFNDTSGTYTVSLRLEISFVGVQQSQIFCVSILTYEIGGVPTMIDNTPRMADIGLSYSGRFIDCASRWHGEDLLTGEIFATVPIEYFYDPP